MLQLLVGYLGIKKNYSLSCSYFIYEECYSYRFSVEQLIL